MKTMLIIVRLFYATTAAFELGHSDAQTLITFDTSPDSSVVMKIQDLGCSNIPDQLILIFDSTSFTYEFSEEGTIAMRASTQTGDTFKITSACSLYLPKGVKKLNNPAVKQITDERVETEEPMNVEDWMLRPADWD
jgi:hypothetical protein